MKLKSLCSILLLCPIHLFSQGAKFKMAPYINMATSIKDGQMEIGPEFMWEDYILRDLGDGIRIPEAGNKSSLKPYIRLPLTNKTDNVLQIDRYTSTWRGIVAYEYEWVRTKSTGPIRHRFLTAQVESGYTDFKYYPTADIEDESSNGDVSYGMEVKFINFFRASDEKALLKTTSQKSNQFRIRYSYDYKASDPVGVVNPPNSNGITTTKDFVLDPPSAKPTFSAAYSFQYYPGKNSFSYAPTAYYDFTGKANNKDPFNDLHRIRLECWVFYYPLIDEGVKIGATPFVSIRTKGDDNFNEVEYGATLTIKFSTTFLQFL